MCDTKKIKEFAGEVLKMDLSDVKTLIVETSSEEERDLYFSLYEFLLKKRQDEVLREHVY